MKELHNILPEAMVKDYQERAAAELMCPGTYIKIEREFPVISLCLSDGSNYYFADTEAEDLLSEVPENISPEDYILAIAQSW